VSITGLEVWLLRRRTPLRYQQRFFGLQQVVTLLDVTEPIAHRAARIDHGCRSQGQRIGLADALIAATAKAGRLTRATHCTQRFTGVPGLALTDWAVA